MLITDPVDLEQANDDVVVPMRHSSGPEGVRQNTLFKLKLFKGEWFLNLEVGMPWLEGNGVSEDDAILGQKFDDFKARAAVREIIEGTPGVALISSLDVSFDDATRDVNISFEVLTVFGDSVADKLKVTP